MKKIIMTIMIFSLSWSITAFADLSDGLVAYYPFNSNANDESGAPNYNGDVQGAIVVEDAHGNVNSAYYFDGDSWIETSLADLSGNEITIAYWFKGTVLQSAIRQQIAGVSSYVVSGWEGKHILKNDGEIDGGMAVGSDATDGSWHHLAMTWKKDDVFVSYLDGVIVESRSSSSTPIPVIAANVYLGSYNGVTEFTNGVLDEVRIYNRALSEEEIEQLASNFYIGASLNPTADPGSLLSAMYTIDDIYNLLLTGHATGKRMGGFTEPAGLRPWCHQ